MGSRAVLGDSDVDDSAAGTNGVDDTPSMQEVLNGDLCEERDPAGGSGAAEPALAEEQHGTRQRRVGVGAHRFIKEGLGMQDVRYWPFANGVG